MTKSAKVLFVPNTKTLEEISELPGAADAVEAAAQRASRLAVPMSPTGTGNYRARHVAGEPSLNADGVVSCGFGNTDFAAHLVEFGSVNNPPHRVLTRAAEALGLDFEPSPAP